MKFEFVLLYAEIIIFCSIILFIVLYKVCKNTHGDVKKLFIIELSAAIIFILFDFITFSVSENNESLALKLLTHVIYFIFTGIVPYLLFLHTEYIQNKKFYKNKKYIILTALPLFILIILSFLSISYNSIFYFDENNIYNRGQLYYIHIIISYGYIIVPLIKLLYKSCQIRFFTQRSQFLSLTSFSIFPIIAGFLQIVIYGVPMIPLGVTLGYMYIYMNLQELEVSIDYLTKVNNRNSLISFLSKKTKQFSSDDNLYLFLIDIDKFKIINDIFGHNEGDEALKILANILSSICYENKCFLYRYGGDEFIIISEVENDENSILFCNKIYDAINKYNEVSYKNYDLKISIGFSRYIKNQTIPSLIGEADKVLYQVKSNKNL